MSHPIPTDSEVRRSRSSLRARPAQDHVSVECEGPPIRRPRLDSIELNTNPTETDVNRIVVNQSIDNPQPIHFNSSTSTHGEYQVGFK